MRPDLARLLKHVAITAASISVAVLAWALFARYFAFPDLVPSPWATFGTGAQMLSSGALLSHVAVSLQRVLVGYAAGCAIGVLMGALMGRIPIVAQFADPLLQLMRPISPVALVPLSIIWFGIGDMSRYFIIFYGVVIIMILNTAAGVASTPNIRLNAARCLGARRGQIFRRIIIPSAVPYILTGMRVALGFAFMGIVAAEMIAAQSGIGYLIMQSRMLLRTDIMFVGLVTLGVLGAVIDGCFKLAINRTMQRFMEHQINV
jgi:NitT/TauT family transport system permease protein/taurine transport system permease protein